MVILLIGPQGSGNHLWSKVFTTWADKEFWVGHKNEPHSKLWQDMDSWRTYVFPNIDNVVSISIPYAVEGKTTFPDVKINCNFSRSGPTSTICTPVSFPTATKLNSG